MDKVADIKSEPGRLQIGIGGRLPIGSLSGFVGIRIAIQIAISRLAR
jgi:hypothetical protein